MPNLPLANGKQAKHQPLQYDASAIAQPRIAQSSLSQPTAGKTNRHACQVVCQIKDTVIDCTKEAPDGLSGRMWLLKYAGPAPPPA